MNARNYPWNGNYVRSDKKKSYGKFMDNFKRGKGDYMGVAGDLNDKAIFLQPAVHTLPMIMVYTTWPVM